VIYPVLQIILLFNFRMIYVIIVEEPIKAMFGSMEIVTI
jgi:hypothetical protein